MSAQIGDKQSLGAVYNNNNTGNFTECSATIRDHVLDDYLKGKMGRILGINPKALLWGQPLVFAHPYNNDEGVIKAYEIVKGLRIDLQKAQVHNDQHGKPRTYACLQVQWGTGSKNTGGAYAGALIRVDCVFSLANIRDALELSFATQSYCRVDPP
jgi:hypothetical protein